MKTPTLLRGVTMVLMIGAFPALVPFRWICLNYLWPPKIGQIPNHGEELIVRDVEGG